MPAFQELIQSILADDVDEVSRRLRANPALATAALPLPAKGAKSMEMFLTRIGRQLYGGDTALHIAAAAASPAIVEQLVAAGADCRARNRRGAEPLHYAADVHTAAPEALARVIALLVAHGAEPNARDKTGVAPLHRAVRHRSVVAVEALLTAGADGRQPNAAGSTPLHLAVQTTGASGSGSAEARARQATIIQRLLAHGARPTDPDGHGKTVEQAATSPWIRALLQAPKAP